MKPTHKKLVIVLGAIVAAALLAVITIAVIPNPKINFNTVQAQRMDLVQAIAATGQVAGDATASLAFDTAGTVARVNVRAGDSVQKGQVLGALSSDILSANLESAQANVVAAQAQLSQLEQGNRPEAVAVYSQKVSDAGTTFATAIRDAYLKVQDALNNKTDALFNNPQSANPTINITTANDIIKNTINNERLTLGEKLTTWGTISGNDFSAQTQATASDTLNYAKKFFTDLAAITGNLTPGNSGLSSSQISAYGTMVNAGASEANTAMSSYIIALNNYTEASGNLTLAAAGGTPQDVQAQSAKVAAAQAQADLVQSQINHTVIRAPFDGTITFANLKIGEVAVTGSPAFGIMSTGLKVEVHVSENDISKINVGNPASITLDAYGANTLFPAQVSQIDPAETVVNGINSYKVTLQFTTEDTRIRSGMTANASIVTAQASSTLAVPSQAIITNGDQKYILTKSQNGTFAEQPVQTGITGTNGFTAIISGVNEGDTVASFGQLTK